MKNVSDDFTSAEPQLESEIIQAAEGDVISLTLFFIKSDPITTIGFLFDIQTNGSATGILIIILLLCILNSSITQYAAIAHTTATMQSCILIDRCL